MYTTKRSQKTQCASAPTMSLPKRAAATKSARGVSQYQPQQQADFLCLPSGLRLCGEKETVVDPLGVLRHCITYFSSHPEVYGTDLQGLIEKEILNVLSLKASEDALVSGQPESGRNSSLPPLIKMPNSTNTSGRSRNGGGGGGASQQRGNELFGFGGLKLQHPESGFMALLESSAQPVGNPYVRQAALPEDVGWDSPDGQENYSVLEHPSPAAMEILNSRRPVVVDGSSYEVSFLRNQLDQVESAFNSKCIRTHELNEENKRLATQLEASENATEKWLHAYNSMQSQMEALKRQLEGWKDKATEAAQQLAAQGSATGPQARRAAGGAQQGGDAKQEVAKITQIWRDTEKALQESRRAFENSEKEANQSHDHLSDAFHYIERLERRVFRRDQYIALATRRQKSLEEKYNKLMWCFQELGTMKGVYSYADFLLADNPVWSLLLFAFSANRLGLFLPGSKKTHHATGPLALQPSPGGGFFSHPSYDITLVTDAIANEVTARWLRKARRRLRTNLHGTVGCRVIRLFSPYTIDFLGGEDTNMDENDLSRQNLPILSLGAVVASFSKSSSSSPATEPPRTDIPNSGEYDHNTLRYFVRSFWSLRLQQFKREMQKRIQGAMKQFSKAKSGETEAASDDDDSNTNKDEGEEEEEEVEEEDTTPDTFLAALITHAVNFANGSGERQPGDDDIQLAVRAVLAERLPDAQVNGRMLFADIINAKARRPVAPTEPQPPAPPPLAQKAEELLIALYYHSLEFKSVDADFRLFFMVSHQLIPEMVGINFYASLEAFKEEALERLHDLAVAVPQDLVGRASSIAASSAPSAVADDLFKDDSSLAALKRVSELVDRTPLVEEDTTIEVDSDGEGYGSIFAGSGEDRPLPQFRSASERRRSSQTTTVSSRPTTAVSSMSPTSTAEGGGGSAAAGRRGQPKLTHNIRAYLEELYQRRGLKFESSPPTDAAEAASAEVRLPQQWMRIDEQICAELGPHSSLLHDYKAVCRSEAAYKKHVGLKPERERRELMEAESARLSAARGLLAVDEVLALFRHHCFAHYAVACCGSPRFSLAAALCPPESARSGDYLSPLSRIGQYPMSEGQLKLLKFALALDQPAPLVRVASLFGYDPHTGGPSNLYNEYLNQTLDNVVQQQKLLTHIVLKSCASRHERYAAEGAEDCHGHIPIAFLKKGLTNAFAKFSVGRDQAHALASHLVNYDKILRMEDDIRLEQFADAPFYLNSGVTEEPEERQDEDEWDAQDEAQTCSLLNITFGVRSTYLIWGPELAGPAARVMRACAVIPPSYTAPVHAFPPSMHGLDILGVPGLSQEEYAELAQFAFTQASKAAYLTAAKRLAAGHTGERNMLRRALLLRGELSLPGTAEGGTPAEDAEADSKSKPPELPQGCYPNYSTLLKECTIPVEEVPVKKTKAEKGATAANAAAAKPAAPLGASLSEYSYDSTLFDLARALGASVDVNPIDGAETKKAKKAKKTKKKPVPDVRSLVGVQSNVNTSLLFSTLHSRLIQFVGRQQVQADAALQTAATTSTANEAAGAGDQAATLLPKTQSFIRRKRDRQEMLWQPVFDRTSDDGDTEVKGDAASPQAASPKTAKAAGKTSERGGSAASSTQSTTADEKTKGVKGFNMPQLMPMKVSELYAGCAVLHTL